MPNFCIIKQEAYMNTTNYTKIFFSILLGVGACHSAWAQTSPQIEPALSRVALSAKRAYQQEQAVAVVSLDWEKPVYLSDKVHRRRPGFHDVLLKTDRQTTTCKGALAAGTHRVVMPASCAEAPDGFSLKTVRVQLANGKQGRGSAGSVAIRGNFASVLVSAQLTAGIKGVPVAAVPQGNSLYETFGRGVQQELLQFFVERGVVSPRASRLTGVKNTLQKGEPFFYQGQLVALVEKVPSRLPVSAWGGVSEDSLLVFHAGTWEELLTQK